MRRSVLWLIPLCVAIGCASDGAGSTDRSGPGGPATGGGGDATAGTGGGATGPNDFGNTDNRVAQPMDIVELPGDGGNMCGATKVMAEQVVIEEEMEITEEITSVEPVAFYLVVDQSFSMVPLWPGAVGGITAFVTDPMSDGIDVAMDFFPGFGAIRGCDGAGYENPIIPMGRLPMHATAVTDMLATMPLPTGIGTPIEGALRGGTAYCENFQANTPDEKCIVVLVTDGAPSGCSEVHQDLVNIVGNAYANGVVTYGVGLAGSDFVLLDQISMEGGADDCDASARYACDVTAGADQLVVALNKIREQVTQVVTRIETTTKIVETPLECEWELPPPENAAQGFDKSKVNVQLSAPSLDMTLGYVAAEGDCVANAWHYDDDASPSRIIACPDTCSTIQATSGAAVDILLGCPTVVIE